MIGFFLGVQFCHSVVSDSLQSHGLQHARPPCPSLTPSLLKLMSIESVMPSNHLILWSPLLLPPSIFPSIRVFSNESVLHIRWPKYWLSASTSVLPVNIFGCTVVWVLTHLLILVTNTTIRIQNNVITPKTSLVLYFLVKLTLSS